jgi:ankyrin repeat protein
MCKHLVGGVLVAGICWSAHLGAAGGELTLVQAVKAGNRDAVRVLLRQPATLNVPEADGTTALHWAVRADDVDTVRLLLRAGARVDVANRYGITPLSLAATNSNAAVIDLLLKAGANAKEAKPEGETVLMTAARTGNRDAVQLLLARGADVNAREQWLGQTALMMAAAENHAGAVAALINAGADVNARSAPTNLPDLQWVPAGMSTTVFPRGHWTPLMFAAQQGALEAARALADGGANLDLVDLDGTNALVFAIINAHYEVAALLVQKGADPNLADTTGMAALYAAVDMNTLPFMHNRPPPPPSGKLTATDLIKVLLAHGANPNAVLKAPTLQKHHDPGDRSLGDGSTPLMRAAKVPDVPVMRLLLANGADPKLTQRNGTNALLFAAGLGRGGAVGYGRSRSGTAQEGIEAIDLLLAAGLDINTPNNDGLTPLHAAATSIADVNALIRFLVDRGANPNLKNKRGQTPLDAARGGARVGTLTAKNEKNVELLTQLTDPTLAASPEAKAADTAVEPPQ